MVFRVRGPRGESAGLRGEKLSTLGEELEAWYLIDREQETGRNASERMLTLTTTRRVEAERSVSGQRG